MGFVVGLQSHSFSTAIGTRITRHLSSASLRLEVGTVTGSWLRDLEVTGLRITSGPAGNAGSWTAAIDTLALTYHLLPLLRKTVALDRVQAVGVQVELESGPAGDWDEPAAGTSRGGASPWRVQVDRVRLRGGNLTIVEGGLSAGSASPWTLDSIQAEAQNLRLGPNLRVTIDSLLGRIHARGQGKEWGRLRVSGAYGPERISLDTLLLHTPESHVRGRGIIPVGGSGPGSEGLEVNLMAAPLHLADIGPFLPARVPDSIKLHLTASARSAGGVLTMDVDGRTGSRGRVRVQADLSRGPSSGPSRTRLRASDVDLAAWGLVTSPFPVAVDVDAEADSTAAEWTGDWTFHSSGIEGSGTGALTPGAPLGWGVAGRLSYSPPDGAPPLPALDSAGSTVSFELRGTGTSLDDLTADGRVEMETGSLGRGVLTDVSLRGEVEAGEALVALEGRLGGGAVRGRGRVDLRALPGWSGRASAELASATYRGVEVDSASVNVVAEGGDMDLTAALALADSGSARLEGRWRRDRDVHVLRVDTLRFASLDVRGFLPDTQATALPPTQLNGLLNGEAKRVAGVWGGRGTLQLDSSTVGTETLRRGKVEGEVDSTGVRMTLDLALLHGELNGEARMDGGGPEAEVTIPEVRFAGLDVGGLLGRPALSTALAGRVQGEIRGTDPKSLTGRVRVALDSSTVAGLPVSSAGLELDADAGKVTASLDASAIGGTVSLRGESDLSGPELTYRARGAISRPAPPPGTGNGRDGPQGTLFARVGLDGSGTDPDSLEGRAWMVVDSASWDRVAVDHGQVEMTVSEGVLRLDSLSLDSQLGTLSGSGRLPLSSTAGAEGDLQINGMFERADMLAPLLGAEVVAVGEATFHLSAQGAMDDLELGGDARINALLVDEIRTEGIEASGKLHRKAGEGFDQGAGHLRIDRLRMPSLPVENLVVDAEMESGEDVAVTASAVLDDSREGRLSLRVQQIPDAPALRVEELEFRADEDQWVLQEPTRIALGSGVEIDSLLLKAGDQEIRARGRVARTGPLSLTVDVTGFRIGTLSDLAGYPALRGEFSGTFSLSGDGASPRMAASFRSALEGGDAPPSDVRFNAAYTGDSLGVDFRARMEGGVGIEAEGTFPVTFSLADSHRGLIDGEPVRLEASVDSLPLEWVGLFLPRRKIRDLHGILDGSVDVTGHPDQPVLEGALTVDGLDLLLPDLGVRYAGGRMDLRLGGDQVSVDSFRIGTEGGTLSGSGSVTISRMDHPKYDLNLVAEGFHAVGSSAVDVTSSGRLHISGTSLEPVVEGRLEILRADVYLGDLAGASEVEGIILTEEDYRELARVFGYRRASDTPSTGPSLFDSATLNLDVGLRRDSWIRKRSNPEMAVQFTGDLTVSKEPGDSIRLVGEVDPVPERSYVQQFGRRFSLAGGSLVFQGSPRTARVDLTAEYAVPSRDNPDQPEVTISLEVTGTPEELNLELSSNPPLEASDMVSYLAVGQPAGRSLGGGEGSLSQAGGALALGRLSSAVEAYAREEVGLDVVEITTDGLDGVTLLAGRYVSPDLYLGIRQPVSLQRTSGNQAERPREPEFEVELQAVRWLLLNLQAGGRGETKVFVRSRISYD